MTRTEGEKKFDCLAYEDRVQAEVHEEIKGMTHEQQIAYVRRATEAGPLADCWTRVHEVRERHCTREQAGGNHE